MNRSKRMKFCRIALRSCTWILPEGSAVWQSDKGVTFHNASWCVAVSSHGFGFLDYFKLKDAADLELAKDALEYGLEVYNELYYCPDTGEPKTGNPK